MLPLNGVRILDLTQVQAGPSCTQLLAWLGADVIKIEEPGKGDRTRWEMAGNENIDSFYFLVFNANKKSMTLNLKNREGISIFKKLLEISDVVIENYAPGRMEEFGLSKNYLNEKYPHVVYASIKGFGNSGPNSNLKSYEHVAQAAGGAMSTNGFNEGPPLFTSTGIGDSGSGLHCAIGILAALRQRDLCGEAPSVDISMQDAVLNLLRVRFVETFNDGQAVKRSGNSVWDSPKCVFPCRPNGPNDYVTMVITGDAWESLLALSGNSNLIGNKIYETEDSRKEHADEIYEIIAAWTKTHSKNEIMEILSDLGIPCSPVKDTVELLNDEHLSERQMIVNLNDPDRGEYKAIGCPIKVGNSEIDITPPPLLGQNTEEVLTELLGIELNQIKSLKHNGVI
ncbi:MAG: CoA transferase [SAR202 cluster bacterium]|nr:CoA transferase [SAR202 cluster bacterium]